MTTVECPYCGRVVMEDNAHRCDCGVETCDGCWELHDCVYARGPGNEEAASCRLIWTLA